MADNYDSPWKRALKHNVLDFIAFFFPQYRDLIDVHRPISFRLLERNVFAWVTAAHLLAQRTHGKAEERYAGKWRLIRLLYERGWRKRRIMDLFTIVHWLMPLPAELESRLMRSIRRLERRHNVEWINPYDKLRFEEGEKKGEKRGIKIGHAQGLQEGLQEGRQEGLRKFLKVCLAIASARCLPRSRSGLPRPPQSSLPSGVGRYWMPKP